MSLPVEPESRMLNAIARTIDEGRAYPLSTIGMIFRFLGSPRAWQLGGERVVLKLDDGDREWLLGAAVELLSELVHGERYFTCPDPQGNYQSWETLPPYDPTNVDVVERTYWLDTMPVEFVERIAALLQSGVEKDS